MLHNNFRRLSSIMLAAGFMASLVACEVRTEVNADTDGGGPVDPGGPAAPGDLQLSAATSSALTMVWSAPSGLDPADLDSYNIYLNDQVMGWSEGTSFVFDNLNPDTLYKLAVASVDRDGKVSARVSLLAKTLPLNPDPDLTPPTLPGSLRATSLQPTSLTLQWNASSDAGSGVKHYRVFREGNLVIESPSLSRHFDALLPNALQNFQVSAVDEAGNESARVSLSLSTPALPDTVAPTTPGSLSVSEVTSTSMRLSWAASSDAGGSIKHYHVSLGSTRVASQVGLSYLFSGLNPDTLYALKVEAVDQALNVSAAAQLSERTLELPTEEDPFEALMTARGHASLASYLTSDVFQVRSFTASDRFGLKVFYARSDANQSPNTIIALSDISLASKNFDQAAVMLRCYQGAFEVRNGAVFRPIGMGCALGNAYMIDFDVDTATRKFALRVQDRLGVVVQEADIAFRSTYSGGTHLRYLNFISDLATASGATRFDRVSDAVFSDGRDPTACGSLRNGESETRWRFQDEVVEQGQLCVDQEQTRTCVAGVLSAWSGSYAAQSCRVNQPGSRPQRVKSFGPNGSHWPELVETPFPYDNSIPHVFEVDASWTAIRAKLQAITAAQANEGALILVRPGLNIAPPSGTAVDSKAYKIVLKDLGSKAWTKRVTIAPRDGYGSVSFSDKLRFENVHGVALAGFLYNSSVRLMDTARFAVAWSVFKDNFVVFSSNTAVTLSEVELVEIVIPDSKTAEADTANVFDVGGKVAHVHLIGSYLAPRFLPTNSDAHVDTWQYGASCDGQRCNNRYSDMFITDSVIYGSANASVQTGRINRLKFDHALILNGAASFAKYPKPAGTGSGAFSTINGSGSNLEALDSIFSGPLNINDATIDRNDPTKSHVWSLVQNTKVTSLRTSIGSNGATGTNVPKVGAFTVDPDLASKIVHPPKPSSNPNDAFLRCIWVDRLGEDCF
jgi:chitodextrinase